MSEIGIVENDKVKWKQFALRIASADFYSYAEQPFLMLLEKELDLYRFNNSFSQNQSLSAREFIEFYLQQPIMEQIVETAKMNHEFIDGEFSVTPPTPFLLNQTPCNRIDFKIQFKFQNN